MRRLVLSVAAAAALASTACKKEEAGDKPAPAGSSAGSDDPARGQLALFVDGEQIGVVDAGKAGTYVPLGALLPPDKNDPQTWHALEVEAGGETKTIEKPLEAHPGLVAGIYVDRGALALGFFAPEDLAKKGTPQASWRGVTAIRVAVAGPGKGGMGGGDGEGGGGEGGERPSLDPAMTITVKVAGGDKTFTGAQLAELPTTTAPIGDTETPGWTVDQILTALEVKPKGKVVLYGTEGANLILEASDLDPSKGKGFIKLNRSGQLRFRLFRKTGEAWDIAGELRGLSEIVVK